MSKVSAFIKDKFGATAIEYGLIAAGISVVIIATVNAIGTTLNAKFQSVSTHGGFFFGEHCMVAGGSLLYRRLLCRRGAEVQRHAARTERNSHHCLASIFDVPIPIACRGCDKSSGRCSNF